MHAMNIFLINLLYIRISHIFSLFCIDDMFMCFSGSIHIGYIALYVLHTKHKDCI